MCVDKFRAYSVNLDKMLPGFRGRKIICYFKAVIPNHCSGKIILCDVIYLKQIIIIMNT